MSDQPDGQDSESFIELTEPKRTAPFAHDRVTGKFVAGTDPRDAVREVMGVFMERTDGTNAMPWWLQSPLRWWHAGPSGWKRGDLILPPSVTGRRPLLNSDPESVYVTSERGEALMYASQLTMAQEGRWPSLYEVSFNVEPQPDDTQPESTTSFRVPQATIRRVESPSRVELNNAIGEILEVHRVMLAASVVAAAEDEARRAAE